MSFTNKEANEEDVVVIASYISVTIQDITGLLISPEASLSAVLIGSPSIFNGTLLLGIPFNTLFDLKQNSFGLLEKKVRSNSVRK